MANELAAVTDNTHYLSIANEDNYIELLAHIYNTEMIQINNIDFASIKIYELYQEFIDTYDELPELADVSDNILIYNNTIIEKMAQIMMKFDATAVAMYQRRMSQFVSGSFVYDEEDAVTEIIEQIMSDLTTEMNTNQEDLERGQIAHILTLHNLPFFLDYSDDIYRVLGFLEDSGEKILVNDCQSIFLQEEYNAAWDKMYAGRGFYDERYGDRLSVVKVVERDRSDLVQLGYEKGW